jgi:hypothetical protein
MSEVAGSSPVHPANLEQVSVVLLLFGGGCVSRLVTNEDLGDQRR